MSSFLFVPASRIGYLSAASLKVTRKMSMLRIALACSAVLVAGFALDAAALPSLGHPSTVASGPRGGTADQLIRRASAAPLELRPVTTAGSRDSLARLEEGAAGFAIVQEDLLRQHLAERRRTGSAGTARAVQRLFVRYFLYVLVRQP